MDSTNSINQEDVIRLECTVQVQKAMIDELSSKMIEMDVDFNIEKSLTAEKMDILMNQNEQTARKLKKIQADSLDVQRQMRSEIKKLRDVQDTLLAEKERFARAKEEMMADVMHRLTDSLNVQDRMQSEMKTLRDVLDTLLAEKTFARSKEDVTEQRPSAVVVTSSAAIGTQTEPMPVQTGPVPEAKMAAGPSTEIPVGSEKDRNNGGSGDESGNVSRTSEDAKKGTRSCAITSDNAIDRLLSSTRPSMRKLKQLDSINHTEIESYVDFLEQIEIEEALPLLYDIHVTSSDITILQLSIKSLGLTTVGGGMNIYEAQMSAAYNCLVMIKLCCGARHE